MSARTAAQEPRQKPGRSRVIWIGRCAGDRRCSTRGSAAGRECWDAGRGRTVPAPAPRGPASPLPVIDRDRASLSAPRNGSAPRHRAAASAFQGRSARRAASRSSGPMSSRPDLPTRCGASQSVDGGREGLVGEVRPFVALGPAEEHHALAPLHEGLRPGKASRPSRREALRQARPRPRVAGTGRGRSWRTSAPSRRTARARRARRRGRRQPRRSAGYRGRARPRSPAARSGRPPGCARRPLRPRSPRSPGTARAPAVRAARERRPGRWRAGIRPGLPRALAMRSG